MDVWRSLGWRGVRGWLAAAALLAVVPAAVNAQLRGERPQIDRVHDRVYVASGYALGNVIFVVTDAGLVVVDTTENPLVAAQMLADFRRRLTADGRVGELPIKKIIYTHFHGDHINGARSFWSPGVEIIAQAEHMAEILKYRLLYGYNQQINGIQWGAALPLERRGLVLSLDPRNLMPGYRPPDTTFAEELKFREGNVAFELYHTRGETLDHLMVWLPELGVLCPGDLFYPAFPMLASPMKPDRPVLDWAASLDRMRELRPAVLAASHGLPVQGQAAIETTLANYARAIRHVHDETVAGLNAGRTLEELRRSIKLPDDLAGLPYLQPLYGRVDWAVNGIYRQYTGWYDRQPAQLVPGPRARLGRELLAAAGGVEPLLARARVALEAGEAQLALELSDVLLAAERVPPAVHSLRAEALERLADQAHSPLEINIYRGAAQDERQRAEGSTNGETLSP